MSGVVVFSIIAVVIKKWELIKFWMFLKFGIQFKDKTEMAENIAEIDYDAFINYKYFFHKCFTKFFSLNFKVKINISH